MNVNKTGFISNFSLACNCIILALGPLLIILFLYLSGADTMLPKWANGLYVSWACTIPIWIGIHVLFDGTYSRARSLSFSMTNFFIPALIAYAGKTNFLTAFYQISSFHFLSLGFAAFIVVVTGMKPQKKLNTFNEKNRKIAGIIPLPLFGIVFFGFLVTLPAIGCELVFLKMIDFDVTNYKKFWHLALRYINLIPEIFILYKILMKNSIFAQEN